MACLPQERKRRPRPSFPFVLHRGCPSAACTSSACTSAGCTSSVRLLSSSFFVTLFSGLTCVPPASCREACRFRYTCRTAGNRHRDPNGKAAGNSAASGFGCFVVRPAIHLGASSSVVDATSPAFARASAHRAGQSRHGRAKPDGRAWRAHTRRRATADGRREGGGGHRPASAPWRVGWGKAPRGPWRAVAAHNGTPERKAFH